MPNCGTLVLWDPSPSNATFKARALGDESKFNVQIDRALDGQTQLPPMRHHDLVPGPATEAMTAADQTWFFDITLNLTDTPEAPVIVEAWMENTDGSRVSVVDQNGNPVVFECQWQVQDAETDPQLAIHIEVVTV